MKNKEYDYLTLYAKKNKVKEVVEYYNIFGWELVNETENSRYEDILDLSFIRPHFINNKDELQLRQVYMEDRLNALGRLERHKNSKAITLGLTMGVFILTMLILSLCCFIKNSPIWCGVFAVIFVAMLMFELLFLPRFHKREKEKFISKSEKLKSELNEILSQVKQFRGDNNG